MAEVCKMCRAPLVYLGESRNDRDIDYFFCATPIQHCQQSRRLLSYKRNKFASYTKYIVQEINGSELVILNRETNQLAENDTQGLINTDVDRGEKALYFMEQDRLEAIE